MINLLLVAIVLLSCIFIFIFFKTRNPAIYLKFSQEESKLLLFENSINQFFYKVNPIFIQVFKGQILIRLILPFILIFIFFAFFINPKITNFQFSLILACLMSITYALRIYYQNLCQFRLLLLSQIKLLFFAIRNNLSLGLSFDQALSNCQKINLKNPIKKEFFEYLNFSQENLIAFFPAWLIKLQKLFKLSEFEKISQVLLLELSFNHNQEQAFEKAIDSLSVKQEQNQKQDSIVMISLLTIDFLTCLFFALLFFVLPNLINTELNWWLSFRREFVVFLSALVLWSMYFLSLFFLLRRIA